MGPRSFPGESRGGERLKNRRFDLKPHGSADGCFLGKTTGPMFLGMDLPSARQSTEVMGESRSLSDQITEAESVVSADMTATRGFHKCLTR